MARKLTHCLKTLTIWLVLAGVFSGCIAYNFEPDVDWGNGPLVGDNNYAVLSGETRGGLFNVSSIRTISNTVLSSDNNGSFVTEGAYFLRNEPTGNSHLTVVPIFNAGDQAYCALKIDGLTLLDGAGAPAQNLDEGAGSVVTGSNGVFKYAQSNWCLAEGERGYAVEFASHPWSDTEDYTLSGFSFTRAAYDLKTYRQAAATLVPKSYEIDADGNLEVTLENEGLEGAIPTSFTSLWLALDENGQPAGAGFFDTEVGAAPTVAVGDSFVLTDSNFFPNYEGPVESIYVNVSYYDESVPEIDLNFDQGDDS